METFWQTDFQDKLSVLVWECECILCLCELLHSLYTKGALIDTFGTLAGLAEAGEGAWRWRRDAGGGEESASVDTQQQASNE